MVNTTTYTFRMLLYLFVIIAAKPCALRYDKLVIAVGSVSSTHGVPGLEHCFQLKTISDAQAIRRRILGMSWCNRRVCFLFS